MHQTDMNDLNARALIADWLRKSLETMNVSQAELGQRINLDQSKISRIISGERAMSAAEMLAVAKELGVLMPLSGSSSDDRPADTEGAGENITASHQEVEDASNGRDVALGARIRQVRENARLSQDAFGEELGVTRGAVGNWEMGKNISFLHMKAIAQCFGVDMNWLTFGSDSMPTVGYSGADSARLRFAIQAALLAAQGLGVKFDPEKIADAAIAIYAADKRPCD